MRRATLLLTALLVAGCGGGEGSSKDPVERVPAESRSAVAAAQEVDPAAFPQPEGRSLEELASQFETQGPQAAIATSVFRTGRNRLAFGILDENLRFVYGDTVVYLQGESGGVEGPFPAPADVLITEARYRSQQAATEKDPFAAVYEAELDLPRTGVWNALIVSDVGGGRRIAATLDFEVVKPAEDEVPDVGEKAPRVRTDTLGSLKGDEELLDTRAPKAPQLHEESFDRVVGRKPVALLFATPQLCQSRVCGPVVDEMLQLRAEYGDRMAFIHQEVFVGNQVDKGLRAPLRAFNLQTEPWLFVVGADGRITARLEGSFGLRAFERAVQTGLS